MTKTYLDHSEWVLRSHLLYCPTPNLGAEAVSNPAPVCGLHQTCVFGVDDHLKFSMEESMSHHGYPSPDLWKFETLTDCGNDKLKTSSGG
jgi:hypothetical protein